MAKLDQERKHQVIVLLKNYTKSKISSDNNYEYLILLEFFIFNISETIITIKLFPSLFNMMDPKDYYSILGLSTNSTEAQIKKAYRVLALKYHPGRNKSLWATEMKKK